MRCLKCDAEIQEPDIFKKIGYSEHTGSSWVGTPTGFLAVQGPKAYFDPTTRKWFTNCVCGELVALKQRVDDISIIEAWAGEKS